MSYGLHFKGFLKDSCIYIHKLLYSFPSYDTNSGFDANTC